MTILDIASSSTRGLWSGADAHRPAYHRLPRGLQPRRADRKGLRVRSARGSLPISLLPSFSPVLRVSERGRAKPATKGPRHKLSRPCCGGMLV